MVEPIDVNQCQVEQRSFMTLGPGMNRCRNVPTHILVERRAGKDKEHGAMSVCDECLDVYKRRYDIKRVIVVNIAPRK